MGAGQNAQHVLDVFATVEQRDTAGFANLVHPDFEIHWPPSLPYGGSSRGARVSPQRLRPTWTETWDPFQPTDAERRMDPRVVAASDDHVVVLWRQRGVSADGDRIDCPVLGLYQLRDGRLVRAQMFYFDTAELVRFFATATGHAAALKPEPTAR